MRQCRLIPFGGALFIFIGCRFDSLKMYWECKGFAMWWKRIESNENYHLAAAARGGCGDADR